MFPVCQRFETALAHDTLEVDVQPQNLAVPDSNLADCCVIEGFHMLQTEVRPGEFGISAQTFNLDPRELLTKELQPLWADNQKLELLRIAFEVF